MGLFVCAYITDLLGAHHVVGAFVYGLILPSGKFADLLLEMLDDFVTAIIVPVYFASFGFRLNLESLWSENHTVLLPLFMVFLLAIPKILSSLLVSVYYGMSSRDGVGLGLLLNTKGIMAVILISIAWDKNVIFSNQNLAPLSNSCLVTKTLFTSRKHICFLLHQHVFTLFPVFIY